MEGLSIARERLASARVARLATADAAGVPHLVPFCFAVERDVIYSAVDWKPKRTQALRRLHNVRQNRRVSVLADHYEEAWDRLWWARADGTARVLPEGDEAEHGLALLVAKYPQYQARPPEGPVLRIQVREWSTWP